MAASTSFINAPVPAVTVGAPARVPKLTVLRPEVSTITTSAVGVALLIASGDQPCIEPRARTWKRWATAHFATRTTSAALAGVHVHTSSTTMSRAQFTNACWNSGIPLGKSAGGGELSD